MGLNGEGMENEEKGTWICCDSCENWVKAEDDNITDISVYDDNNPNHLDYFCPNCREAPRRSTRQTSGRGKEGGAPAKRPPGMVAPLPSAAATTTNASSTRSGRSAATRGTPGSPPKRSRTTTRSRNSKSSEPSEEESSDNGGSEVDSEEDAASQDRILALWQELVAERSPTKRQLEELTSFRDSLLQIRKQKFKAAQEQLRKEIGKTRTDLRALNGQSEEEGIEKLRKLFEKASK